MTTKECTSCNVILSIDKFYRDRTPIHSVSYRSKCKDCSKILQNNRIQQDPDMTITNKICSVCNIEKPIDTFYKSYRHKDGYFKWCNICHENKVKNKGNNKKIKRTPEYMKEYNKEKSKDIIFQLKYQVRSNLHSYLRRNINSYKNNSTMKYIGCSFEFLKKWFEYNFDKNMSWDNRGSYWHIDHIKPCNSYDLTIQTDIYLCYNWTNLRPLEKTNNILKSDIIDNILIKQYEAKSKQFIKTVTYNIENEVYVLLPEVKALILNNSEESGELTGNP
jgi:hypothetical protein